jgi:hypothetical protein
MFKCVLFTVAIAYSSLLAANPMRPDSASQSVTRTTQSKAVSSYRYPRLDTIIIIGELKKAVFNGNKEVKEGETISGFKVGNIASDSVTLIRGNKKKTLYLSSQGEFRLSPAKEE